MSLEIPLVLEIQKRQCLYNFNLPEYNRKDILEEAWNDVAATVNLSVNECKDKWKNIRSSFVRSLKLSSGKLKKPYYLSNYLQFILPYIKISTNNSIEDWQADSNENTSEETITIKLEPEFNTTEIAIDPIGDMEIEKPVSEEAEDRYGMRRRKRHISLKNAVYPRTKSRRIHQSATASRSDLNAMRFFLLSLLPEFDTMDEEQIRLFKIKVMTLIDEIKTSNKNIRQETSLENERIQKRLINLLLKNLEKGN